MYNLILPYLTHSPVNITLANTLRIYIPMECKANIILILSCNQQYNSITESHYQEFRQWQGPPQGGFPSVGCRGCGGEPSGCNQWWGRHWHTACTRYTPPWRGVGGSRGQKWWPGSQSHCRPCNTCRSWCTCPHQWGPRPAGWCPGLPMPRYEAELSQSRPTCMYKMT